MKNCTSSQCPEKNPQEVTRFNKASRENDGLNRFCKTCTRRQVRKSYDRTTPEFRRAKARKHYYSEQGQRRSRSEYMRQYRRAHKQSAKGKESRKRWLLRKVYGLSIDGFNALLESQGGGCGICGDKTDPCGRALAIDHCHDSGKIRGILCSRCNIGIGQFRDDDKLLAKAIEYLQSQS